MRRHKRYRDRQVLHPDHEDTFIVKDTLQV
jgi:hypothetical protein